MSRPKPDIIIENVDSVSYSAEQILDSDGIYAIFYNGKPINIRTLNKLTNSIPIKYTRCSFSNPGHAFNLAKRLNEDFRTNSFTVVLLTQGTVVEK
jgi:hypothetical protein